MFPGWYSRNFWTRDDIPDCTPAQRESVIDRSIAPLNYPLPIIDDENYTADDLSIVSLLNIEMCHSVNISLLL